MTGKVVAITGANKGLGFATAKELANLNAEVHLLCRDIKKAEEAKSKLNNNKNVYCHQLDVSSFSDVREFSNKFQSINYSYCNY